MSKYWRSPEEMKNGPAKDKETGFESDHKNAVISLLDSDLAGKNTSRRDFLKLMGFSLTAATLVASCERPVVKTIPYLIKPDEITPGKASYYATSFFDGSEYASLLAKTRDGRPIKLEGNDLSPFSRGKSSARVQASVLSLYDEARYREPMKGGQPLGWDELDKEVAGRLSAIEEKGGKLVLLSPTVISPSTRKVIKKFGRKYSGLKWVKYDPVSFSGMLLANEKSFGKKQLPVYDFAKADIIVSFGADFLGTWLNPVGFSSDYAGRRKLEGDERNMSKHYQFESGMSVTGSNADKRYPVKPSEQKAILLELLAIIESGASQQQWKGRFDLEKLATELKQSKGRSLLVSGSNDSDTQMLVNRINYVLENYGTVINTDRALKLKEAVDLEMTGFIDELGRGEVDGLILMGSNPLYDHPRADEIGAAMEKMELSLSLAYTPDESSAACELIAPGHHYLEAWDDMEPVQACYSLAQPTIHPLFNTRQAPESLLKWAGGEEKYSDFIKKYWEEELYSGTDVSFKAFWTDCLQKGIYVTEAGESSDGPEWIADVNRTTLADKKSGEGLELELYQTVALGDGKHANNPWLQELPDAVTKACWDNYLCISPGMAEERGLENEDVIMIEGLEIPVFIQPGQAEGTVSLAVGYGRQKTGKVADGLGVNAWPFAVLVDGDRKYHRDGIEIKLTSKKHELALTQTHNYMEGRPIIRETSLEEFKKDPGSGNEFHFESEKHKQSLYKEIKFEGHHWGMAINLNACTSCGACIIACQAENNIPVVGKDEVRRRRILHWMRIDRYYSEDPENPEVFNQPVMCQHCDNAPCENVCPVSATMHSNEGINQVAYNRCIGTKYCINNCPYRVRRFNWFKYADNDEFDYTQNSDLSKMVLNPDVVVRERGVVEKCSFCVQRIQEKKLEAKLENRPLEDGEIQPACVQVCPTDALVFGDLNDPESKVSKLFRNQRNYHLLEELHTLPSVGYLTKVRNTEPGLGHDEHGDEGHENEEHS